MANPGILTELPKHTRDAVRFHWQTRSQQVEKQRKAGGSDQGSRSAVTGGAQMNGFIELLTKLVIEAGVDASHIYYRDSLELPGYFRPSKRWDFLVVVKNQLIAALESESQVGPSFGNNFNNRTEEAMGSALTSNARRLHPPSRARVSIDSTMSQSITAVTALRSDPAGYDPTPHPTLSPSKGEREVPLPTVSALSLDPRDTSRSLQF